MFCVCLAMVAGTTCSYAEEQKKLSVDLGPASFVLDKVFFKEIDPERDKAEPRKPGERRRPPLWSIPKEVAPGGNGTSYTARFARKLWPRRVKKTQAQKKTVQVEVHYEFPARLDFSHLVKPLNQGSSTPLVAALLKNKARFASRFKIIGEYKNPISRTSPLQTTHRISLGYAWSPRDLRLDDPNLRHRDPIIPFFQTGKQETYQDISSAGQLEWFKQLGISLGEGGQGINPVTYRTTHTYVQKTEGKPGGEDGFTHVLNVPASSGLINATQIPRRRDSPYFLDISLHISDNLGDEGGAIPGMLINTYDLTLRYRLAESPAEAVELTLLDANTALTHEASDLQLPLQIEKVDELEAEQRNEQRQNRIHKQKETLVKWDLKRKGAVADGVSLMLLRAEAKKPGKVVFQIPGEYAGRLDQLDGSQFRLQETNSGSAGDLSRVEVETVEFEGKHYAFALYAPPADFSKISAGKKSYSTIQIGERTTRMEFRSIPVEVSMQEINASTTSQPTKKEFPLILARPPVVLVHGTYDNPKNCWQTKTSRGPALLQRLTNRGLAVYTVDFESTNGRKGSGPSRFEDNKRVVWSKEHGGIEQALEDFRGASLNLAATQADVVGHSLGGVLPRVYASPEYNASYKRPANFNKGDIHRLITIASTHHGSDMPRVFHALRAIKIGEEGFFDYIASRGLFGFADWKTGLDTGAALDQIPTSKALQKIGPTSVPAHAIGLVSTAGDMYDFEAKYRNEAIAVCEVFYQHPKMLAKVFNQVEQKEDAERLLDFLKTLDYRRNKGFLGGNLNDEQVLMLLFRAAVFGNTQNDCTVRLQSQLGGLRQRYTSTVCNVLHGFAPRYPAVQSRVIELLTGPAELFDPKGFPAAGQPLTNVSPGEAGSKPWDWSNVSRGEAIARSNIVPEQAASFSEVARDTGLIIVVRPVNQHATARIAEGAATKNMRIKGKSADWGPQKGFIPTQQRLSKLGRQTAVTKEEIAKFNRLVQSCIKAGDATEKVLDYDDAPYAGKRLIAVKPSGADGRERVVVDIGNGRYYDPDEDQELVANQYVITENEIKVLADQNHRPLTADYDLLAIGTPRGPPTERGPPPRKPIYKEGQTKRFDKERYGAVYPWQIELIKEINFTVDHVGGDVVHHGPENQYDGSPGVDYPNTAFEPNGLVIHIPLAPGPNPDRYLQQYFREKFVQGFNLEPNDGWGWKPFDRMDQSCDYTASPVELKPQPEIVEATPQPQTPSTAAPEMKAPAEEMKSFFFRNVEAGTTTVDQLLQDEKWGEPVRRSPMSDGSELLEFRVRGYKRVNVVVRGDRVQTIDVTLPDGVTPESVAQIFKLGEPREGALSVVAKIGTTVSADWKAQRYSAGRVVLFIDESGAKPVAQLMRVYALNVIPMQTDEASLVKRSLQGQNAESRQITKAVLNLLATKHLQPQELNQEIAQRWLQNYVKALDPLKLFFFQSDIDEFQKQSEQIIEGAAEGNIDFAYDVFYRYLERRAQNLKIVREYLSAEHDFTLDEEILNLKKVPYPDNELEAREIWRKRVKLELLKRKAKGYGPVESLERVKRHYECQFQLPEKIDDLQLLEWSLSALAKSYNANSTYYSARSIGRFQDNLRRQIVGIGAQLQIVDGDTEVVSLPEGGAAARSGALKTGDRIIAVAEGEGEFESVSGLRLTEIVDKIRGKQGTVVRLKVISSQKNQPTVIELTRDQVQFARIRSTILNEQYVSEKRKTRIGFVSVPAFYSDSRGPSGRSSSKDLEKILKAYEADGVEALVLDLRNNSGGMLAESFRFTSLFIGQRPLVQTKDQSGKVQTLNGVKVNYRWNKPLVVLTNKFSSGGAEIFIAAIQDYRRGLILGDSTTYGSASIQNSFDIGRELFKQDKPPQLGILQMTTRVFYRPTGDVIHLQGVVPDIQIPSYSEFGKTFREAMSDTLHVDPLPTKTVPHDGYVNPELVRTLSRSFEDRSEDLMVFQDYLDQLTEYKRQSNRATTPLNEEQYLAEYTQRITPKYSSWNDKNQIERDAYFNEVMAIALEYTRKLEWVDDYQKGKDAFARKQFETVVTHLSAALDANPDLTDAYKGRANAYAALKQWKQALADYQHVKGAGLEAVATRASEIRSKSETIADIARGERLLVLDEQGKWLWVEQTSKQKKQGWILKEDLRSIYEPSKTTKQTPAPPPAPVPQ
ncbi:alpha/beta fold hydrolase [Gimesia alba]|nr:alpha/beta fold hydrolase [Gimesia alba]